MKRLRHLLAASLVFSATAALGAVAVEGVQPDLPGLTAFPDNPYEPIPDPDEVIVIEVAPEDLARCEMTLAQVLTPPVDTPQLTPAAAEFQGPTVRCAAK